MKSTILGYPRIGPRRELKRAVERYWAGGIDERELTATAAELRRSCWRQLRDAGLDEIPSGTFSFYDHVLDTAVLFDAVPERYRRLGLGRLDTTFAMARGTNEVAPLEMTKWFDTNYHYVVPEIGPETVFRLAGRTPLAEVAEAREVGVDPRPVLLGPVTFLLLSTASPGAEPGFRPLDRLDDLVERYAELLGELAEAGVGWVQLDEPALVADRTPEELAAVERAYRRLGGLATRPRLLVATYFGELGAALPVLARAPIEAVGLDLVAGRDNLRRLADEGGLGDKVLVAGVVDGRNVWRTDLRGALSVCVSALGLCRELVVGTSCSLLHVPHDLDLELSGEPTGLDPSLRPWLAFARQKVDEVVVLARALREGPAVVSAQLNDNDAALRARRNTDWARVPEVRRRVAALRPEDARRSTPREERVRRQREVLGLPLLPTTTIGSFPQTKEIRAARAGVRSGRVTPEEYERRMRAEIDRAVAVQEEIGLDVVVHGEPERNDMVQYFAERLVGFASTEHGWVQSYGTRCVRPPIIYGDVSRPEPITVEWARYARSRTSRPVKGMLTGPVTMVQWSFVRDDQPRAETAKQVALALRDEVADLEAAGIGVIQVDEPALREGLPPRAEHRAEYLDWAVTAFRLATSGVRAETQIHTHMCYSEFGEIIDAIEDLDADVTTVEAARSGMRLVADLGAYRGEIGPGVYDIHSPRVPSVDEIEADLRRVLEVVDARRVWVNPDCGLKTRDYPEVTAALRNMVAAAERLRAEITVH
ncbi:methionine synthase (B12-independent) [Streptoalloteichus tenebrarius]|uniref:5-methyltetrahydropteroyltriglutamate--homocysteine methyltransferase n=1 Tax=Streptoalloteichus tenebrarius (strain ATCC 17920 / DSM 40477 / JCM 4838 / CBS 697.72 / NBRC 16177 / NCIMB 11028 / NRRL B-12390 / A12253. 1 / ISP 5477) TaxID=1933 RepID=A0ABT1HQN2_STRSD|nr:5-methyltetrahydropteroyltriglutamate--homocysteine S-methyltransferase [Streptoalloteichus tenebrarius]MCP2257831.1 methionine synthase (B12-independent) [Streptoalloteichus tenebrarius]BFE99807.1 5-methyltetrahydropteroyltriglutamate--homocysteine S-methyltransferase [Streptoalloteichus tenebrarius]